MSLIVALDFPDLESCERLLRELKGLVKIYKIGSELFTAHGWRAVELVERAGGKVFLDLKLHDIPTTVGRTARIIARKKVSMFNVHTLGGLEMMREARKAVDQEATKVSRPLLLGVTILTSLEQRNLSRELGIDRPLREEVVALARLAQQARLDGAIASPEEIDVLRQALGNDFLLVTPGIRPAGSPPHDQKRSLTPREAIQRGANYLVIGRPITASAHPRLAAQEILQSLA